MRPSGIGGQAVIEGIMMRNKDKYSIAVRKPDNEIEVVVREKKMLSEKYKWSNYPIIRGVINFADSLVTGVSTISYSASFYDDPAEQKKTKADEIGKNIFKDKLESVLMAVTIIISIAFAVALFMILPYFASRLMSKYISSGFLLNFLEGMIRIMIFMLYIFAISRMNDIKRTFMYHGAEHKCINCIESGARLTPENVKNSSRLHKRCGTSFLFFVMFVSVIFFIFIRVENVALQLVIRILLIPVIAGVSYELIKWAGRGKSKVADVLSKPGMWLQKFTTKEPDMDMIEVAIEAVEAVFDWKDFLKEFYQNSENPETELEANEAALALSSNLIINTKKKTRTISTDEAQSVKEATETEAGYESIYDQETFNRRFEDSDESESTLEDNYDDYDSDEVQEDDFDDILEDDAFSISDDDDTYDNALRSRDDILNRNYEAEHKTYEDETDSDETLDGISYEDTYENGDSAVSLENDSEEYDESSEEDVMAEFEFEDEEEIDKDDTCADDVPVFRQKDKN